MKGKLYKTEKGWVVTYMEDFDSKILPYRGSISIPVHPHQKVDEDAEGGEVYFKAVYFWETVLKEPIKVAELIKPGYPGYPELGETIQSDEKTWDEIFVEVEGSLHFEMPIRVKNWLKNKFKSPVKK